MNLYQRYRRLTVWNKLQVWGALAGIVSLVIYVIATWLTDTAPNTTTELVPITPKNPTEKTIVGDAPIVTAVSTTGSTISLKAPEGSIIQPLGQYLPIWFSIGKNQLLIDAVIRSSDSQIIAEIRGNRLVTNPQNTFKTGRDEYGFEVIDHFGIPVLQVDFINSDTFRIGGVFQSDASVVDNRYPDFPARTINAFCMEFGPDALIVLGINGLHTDPARKNINEFIGLANKTIPPLFDYSNGTLVSSKRFKLSADETKKSDEWPSPLKGNVPEFTYGRLSNLHESQTEFPMIFTIKKAQIDAGIKYVVDLKNHGFNEVAKCENDGIFQMDYTNNAYKVFMTLHQPSKEGTLMIFNLKSAEVSLEPRAAK